MNNTIAKQWYTSDQGEKLLSEIYQKLKEPFPTTELYRDVENKDIRIVINMDQNEKVEAKFPNDFPNSSVHVKIGRSERQIKFAYNRNSTVQTLATDVANRIGQMVFGQS